MTGPDVPTSQSPSPTLEGEFALVFAADEGFARATGVAMHSALEHLSPGVEPDIYVLDNGLTTASQDRLGNVAFEASRREIRWLQIPSELLVSAAGPHLTSTTYARLLIPGLLPPSVRRVVYLDGDVLVREDLSPLFRVELGAATFAAVRDFASPRSERECASVQAPVEPSPYFNPGILVMDLKRWRTKGFGDRVLAFARTTEQHLPYADQDAMNAVATPDDWFELDFRWNVQVLLMYRPDLPRTHLTDWIRHNRADLYRNAAVIHFNALPKPWEPWSYGTSKGKTLWARQLIRSGWYGPMESLRWFVPWVGRRIIDAARRPARAPRRLA